MRDTTTELLEPLVADPPVAPDVERVIARGRRRRRRRSAVVSVAAAVLLVGGVAVATSRQDPGADVTTFRAPGPSATESSTTTAPEQAWLPEVDPGRTPKPVIPPTLALDERPPWDVPVLRDSTVPEEVRAWGMDAAASSACPLLAPDDLGAGAGATARATTRGQPGAWWIAYDLPGAPGEVDIQSPAPGAGRETFFVSGTAGARDVIGGWELTHEWTDGSRVGYGPLGRGEVDPVEGMEHSWLAYLQVAGSDCFYQVHSYLGADHLIHLLNHLRHVQGAP